MPPVDSSCSTRRRRGSWAWGDARSTSPEWSATYGCFYDDGRTPFPSEQLPLARALRGEASTADVFIRNPSLPNGVFISITGTPIREEDGQPDGGVVVFRDVTAAKLAEQRVQASVKRLEDLRYAVNQAAMVGMTDRDGRIIYTNEKFSEASGYAREELVGQTHRVVNSGFHPAAFFTEMWLTITAGQVWRGRICNRAKDGRHFWVDTTIVPLLVDGRPDRYLALRTDITEQMRQQAELVRLSNAVEQTADAIFITDRDGIIEYVNPAFEVDYRILAGRGGRPDAAHSPLGEAVAGVLRGTLEDALGRSACSAARRSTARRTATSVTPSRRSRPSRTPRGGSCTSSRC